MIYAHNTYLPVSIFDVIGSGYGHSPAIVKYVIIFGINHLRPKQGDSHFADKLKYR